MESEPIRNRASLLTSAPRQGWASTAPLSARGWLTELARCPAGNRRLGSALGRFESCAIRPGEASRVPDDGSGPENRRAREGLVGPSPTLSAVDAQSDRRRNPA